MGNAASGGSSGTSRSRGGGGGASSGNDYNNAMVFSNGRLAAAETKNRIFNPILGFNTNGNQFQSPSPKMGPLSE
ncbi:unnamed protein product [Caenorhabditis nigoni]